MNCRNNQSTNALAPTVEPHNRPSTRGTLGLGTCLIAVLLAFVATACGQNTASTQSSPAPQGLELPTYSPDEDIVGHLGYTASYNHTTLCPDWVAWELTAEEADGLNDGQFSFSRDPDVAFPKASREDYSHSGWDKGHMAPRADMRWSCQALEESYYFTNICPQDHTMNSQAWRKIEELTRRLAQRHGQVWIVCGPIFDTVQAPTTIGEARVWVPTAFYKALAISTADGYQTVGFVVENTPQDGSPRRYAVSVDSVEALVGRNLFPTLPEAAEAQYNWNTWNR